MGKGSGAPADYSKTDPGYWASRGFGFFGLGPEAGQGAADKQHAADQSAWQQQTQANRPNVNTDFGSQSWKQGADGRWTMNSSLDPAMQGSLQSLMGQMNQNYSTPLDNGADARKHAEDAIYSSETSRLDPRFSQQEQTLKTQLANQGLDPTSEAYKTEMGNFGNARNDAYQGAMNNSIMGGGQEASRQQQMDLTSRNSPLMSLLQMQGFGQMPGFMGAGGLRGADYMGAGADQNSASMGGMAALTKLLMSLSDERAKQNITRLTVEAMPGVPWALWEYRHEPGVVRLGVIAQDLESKAPQWVATGPDGLKYVNYAFLGGES